MISYMGGLVRLRSKASLGAQGICPGLRQEGHDVVPGRDTVRIKQNSVVAVEELDRRPE